MKLNPDVIVEAPSFSQGLLYETEECVHDIVSYQPALLKGAVSSVPGVMSANQALHSEIKRRRRIMA